MALIIKLLLIASPAITAYIVGPLAVDTTEVTAREAANFLVLLGIVVGVPIVAVVGGVINFALRKVSHGKWWSIIGYALPAAILCGMILRDNL